MHEDPPNAARRRGARAPITLIVEYDGAGDLIEDYASNLSVGGTFVHTERHMPKGTVVDLVLSFPGLLKPIQLSGVVRWSSRGHGGESNGVGIEFTGHDELARARLQSVIDAIGSGDARFVGRVMQVLLVEDNPHIARLIRDGLSQASRRTFDTRISFEFDLRVDGQEAMDALRTGFVYDAMIIDMTLPIVSGAQIIEYVRSEPRHLVTPVIAVSASENAEEDARNAGCHYFLPKPLKLRQLTGMMARLMEENRPIRR